MSAKRKGGSGGDDAAPAKKKGSSSSSSSSAKAAAAAAPALPFVPPDFDPTRARVLTSRTQSLPAAGGACVVLWMSRDQRAEDNHAMLYARGVAAAHNVPVKVLFNLVPTFLEATLRQVTYGCVHVPLFHFLLQYYLPRPAVRLHDHWVARDGARPARQAHSVPSHDGGPGYVIVLQLISTHIATCHSLAFWTCILTTLCFLASVAGQWRTCRASPRTTTRCSSCAIFPRCGSARCGTAKWPTSWMPRPSPCRTSRYTYFRRIYFIHAC